MFGELKFAKIVPGEVNGLGQETHGVVQRIGLGNDRAPLVPQQPSLFSVFDPLAHKRRVLITAGVFSYSTAVRDLVAPPKRVIL